MEYLRELNLLIFILAAGIYILSIYISSIRWSLFLKQRLGLKTLFSIYMIGSFFNICLPSIISGDGVRLYYLTKELKKSDYLKVSLDEESNAHKISIVATASIFLDRYMGLSALMIIGMLAFPFGFRYLEESSRNQLLIWLMPVSFIAFFAISLFLLISGSSLKRVKFVSEIYEYLLNYRTKKNILLKGLIYSLIIQILGIFSAYLLSTSMTLKVPIVPLLIYMPLIILISLIPISISGIGVREFAFAFFLSSVGVPSSISLTLSLAWYLSIVIASLVGLVIYLKWKS